MDDSIDFEAEGLLEGLEGAERAEREELLAHLVEQGVELDDIRAAAAEGRLTVVAVERELAGLGRYSAKELAERSGVELDLIIRNWQALGMAVPESDEQVFTKNDLEAAHHLRSFLDSGIPADMIIDSARVIALTMSQFAASNRELVIELAGDDVGEAELSRRFAFMARTLVPMIGPTLEHAYRLQLREQIRHAMIVAGAPGSAEGEQAAIAFADLVGFTTLGERVDPTALGAVSGRLAELASAVSGGPIRLVKLLGDGLMFVSADLEALVAAMLDLVDAADDEPEGFPPLRAGVAYGPLMSSGGDYYGSIVNRASRVADVARASSVLVTALVQEELGDDAPFDFRYAGKKTLKGVHGSVHVYRVRRPKP